MRGILSPETIITWKLWLFGFSRIPLIFFCRPRVIKITATSLEVIIKLNRRTRNHLHSMYFGVLSVGADITGGFLAMEYCRASSSKISLIFKDFHADFLKRAEGDVHFTCTEGSAISALVKKSEKSGKRENMPVNIIAWVPSISPDPVAKFILTLSIKLRKTN